jgi:hypothetical protein
VYSFKKALALIPFEDGDERCYSAFLRVLQFGNCVRRVHLVKSGSVRWLKRRTKDKKWRVECNFLVKWNDKAKYLQDFMYDCPSRRWLLPLEWRKIYWGLGHADREIMITRRVKLQLSQQTQKYLASSAVWPFRGNFTCEGCLRFFNAFVETTFSP